MKIYNLKEKKEYLKEVVSLEYEEWASDKENDKQNRINNKIEKINKNMESDDFCKLILLDENILVGFISIFPHDCKQCMDLTPWYATMYVKKEYRGKGYSKILNDAILEEAKKRNYDNLYLKTTLNNYYEKFGAELIRTLDDGEKIYKFKL